MHEAFTAYENVRHRLPAVRRRAACQRMPDLDAISDEFDVFLLDAFGVLNIGEAAIEGVPDRVKGLQQAGKRVVVVSNAAGYPHSVLMEKYRRLGYNFDPEDVITSRKALLTGVRAEPARKWGLIAAQSFDHNDLDDVDVTFLADDEGAYDTAEAFLMLGSSAWTERRQTLLESALKNSPRPVYVGNPDIVAPRENGFSTEPGSFAHRLAEATGVEPKFFGKPFNNIFDLAFARLAEFDPERTVMVGDSLHTDILGGQEAGVKTALISGYGFFSGQEVEGFISSSGIQPDYILDQP